VDETMNITPQAPYFGSFNPRDNYIRVLFRPERAVQNRELIDMQLLAQHQTGTLGSHIFKNGSRVSNARFNITKASYIRLQEIAPGGATNLSGVVEGDLIHGVASGVEGVVVAASTRSASDPDTLFVQYTKLGIDGVQGVVVPGEELVVTRNEIEITRCFVKCPSCPDSVTGEVYPTGKSVMVAIDEGIFFYNNAFITVARQTKILSKYPYPDADTGSVGQTVFRGMTVGLEYIEDVVTSDDDVGLLDNALGYPNEAGEGADRLRARLLLAVRGYDDRETENFIVLARIDSEGRIDFVKSDMEYSAIMDAIAKRTFETNGNYTVRPFKVSFFNHRREEQGDPRGWVMNGSDDKLVALVDPSVGYVKGYRTEVVVPTPVLFDKARQTKRVTGAILPFDERAYIVLEPGPVTWPNDVSESSMVSPTPVTLWSDVNGTGDVVGTMVVYNIGVHSGPSGAARTKYRYYFTDLKLAAGKSINDMRSATKVQTGFAAAAVLSRRPLRVEIRNPGNTSLIFKLPYSNVKTLRTSNPSSPGSMIITVRKKVTATLNASGVATIDSTTNQSFVTTTTNIVGMTTNAANQSSPYPITEGTITVTAGQISLRGGLGRAGERVTLLVDVLMTNQTQSNKGATAVVYTRGGPPPSNADAEIRLGVVDVFKLRSVKLYDYTNAEAPVMVADVTADWALLDGITSSSYGESRIVKKTTEQTPFSSWMRLHVEYSAFTHTGQVGFFTADSYASILRSDTNPTGELTYETLPSFTDNASQTTYRLADCIDFRPSLLEGAAPTVVPAPNATAVYEAEFYLPRVDLLQLHADGMLAVKQGLPSETPRPPAADEDAMALYQIWMKPYTYSLDDIGTKFIENKRYTMRDIGRLEKRIGTLEYYTVLSMLEQRTASMSIKDADGFDRYKNGFLADDFSGFKASDLNHPEFHAAVDATRFELRPSFKSRNVKLKPNKELSTGIKWLGSVALRDYDSELADEQPYATKHISINPYFQVAKKGRMVLSPNIDTWSDDTILPAMTTEIDAGVDALRSVAEASGVLGTTWGAWSMQNQTIVGVDTSVSVTNGQRNVAQSTTNGTTVTTTTTRQNTQTTSTTTATTTATEWQREGVETSVGSRTQTYTTGEMVRSVSIIPYIRPTRVQFAASGMKPNARIYAFFDSEAVSAFCRDLMASSGDASSGSARAALALGSPMYTDANGEIVGEFHIPGGRFFTGQKSFRLTSNPDYDDSRGGAYDPDQETTYAEALFFAGGLDVTKQESRLNIITPTFSSENVSEGRTDLSTSVQTSTQFVVTGQTVTTANTGRAVFDPVAQSFSFSEDRFVESLDVYFQAVDKVNDKIFVEIRSMVNGYPSTEVLSRKEFSTTDILVSDDATAPLHVRFDYPVFVQAGTEYCFVVGGWSPDTRIWVAKMGGQDVANPAKTVETQPSIGSSFRSQNGSTWNAEQFEDIKYRLYVAKFKSQEMNLVLENDGTVVDKLPPAPIETQQGSSRVRIHHPSHGFVEGDKTTLRLLTSPEFTVSVTPGAPAPKPGQTIATSTGTAVIDTVEPLSSPYDYELKLKDLSGKMSAGQSFNTNGALAFAVSYLLETISSSFSVSPVMSGTYGNVVTGTHASFTSENIVGIPVEQLQRELTVLAVDSNDSYIVDCGATAAGSRRDGGNDCSVVNANIRYDVLNISGSALSYGSGESWAFTGIGHGQADSPYVGDNYRQLSPVEFSLASDVHLPQPMKLAGPGGETANSVKSLRVAGSYHTFRDAYVSPVVNTDAFSATTVSSNVDWETPEQMDVIPNASGRFIDETHPVNGTSPYKYVSVTARLQDAASDLRLMVAVYKDVNADFDIYIKVLTESDSISIDDKPWMKVEVPRKPNSVDLTDFKEIDVLTADNVAGWSGEPFIAYKVKLTGKAKNTCKPPIFKDLRAIAVT
jgi:hypothetical protein